VWLVEQDAVAQEGEAGAAVHLTLDHLGLGVHALGPAVMERQGDGCGSGRRCQSPASEECGTVGRSSQSFQEGARAAGAS
jgi:hypothetical protein